MEEAESDKTRAHQDACSDVSGSSTSVVIDGQSIGSIGATKEWGPKRIVPKVRFDMTSIKQAIAAARSKDLLPMVIIPHYFVAHDDQIKFGPAIKKKYIKQLSHLSCPVHFVKCNDPNDVHFFETSVIQTVLQKLGSCFLMSNSDFTSARLSGLVSDCFVPCYVSRAYKSSSGVEIIPPPFSLCRSTKMSWSLEAANLFMARHSASFSPSLNKSWWNSRPLLGSRLVTIVAEPLPKIPLAELMPIFEVFGSVVTRRVASYGNAAVLEYCCTDVKNQLPKLEALVARGMIDFGFEKPVQFHLWNPASLWYYVDDAGRGEEHGPVPFGVIESRFRCGDLTIETPVLEVKEGRSPEESTYTRLGSTCLPAFLVSDVLDAEDTKFAPKGTFLGIQESECEVGNDVNQVFSISSGNGMSALPSILPMEYAHDKGREVITGANGGCVHASDDPFPSSLQLVKAESHSGLVRDSSSDKRKAKRPLHEQSGSVVEHSGEARESLRKHLHERMVNVRKRIRQIESVRFKQDTNVDQLTPWIPDRNQSVALGEELFMLSEWCKLTEAENGRRQEFVNVVKGFMLQHRFPRGDKATPVLNSYLTISDQILQFGSTISGLDTFLSDVDVMITLTTINDNNSFSDISPVNKEIELPQKACRRDVLVRRVLQLAHAVKSLPDISSCKAIAGANVPVIKLTDSSDGFTLDIVLVDPHRFKSLSASAGNVAHKIQKVSSEEILFTPIVHFVQLLLHQHRLDKLYSGGMNSFRVYVIVLSFLEGYAGTTDRSDASRVLLHFLEFYGRKDVLNRSKRINSVLTDEVVLFNAVYRLPEIVHLFRTTHLILSRRKGTKRSLISHILSRNRFQADTCRSSQDEAC